MRAWVPTATSFTFLAILLFVLPLAGLGVLSLVDRTNVLEVAKPVWAPVSAAHGELDTPVDLALSWHAEPALVAPQWSGTVTEIVASSYASINSGDVVVRVNGIARLAIASAAPFYRELNSSSTGQDVEALNVFLKSENLPFGQGTRFSGATRSGVQALAAKLGVENPRTVQAFDPGWAIFLPRDRLAPARLNFVVGAPAPVPGTELSPATAVLSAARIVAADSLFIDSQPTPAAAQGSLDLSKLPDPQIAKNQLLVLTDSQKLFIAGVELQPSGTRDSISPQDLPKVDALVSAGVDHLRAQIATKIGPGRYKVPSASIFVSSSGTLCVIAGTLNHSRPIPVRVDTDDSAGTSIVEGRLEGGLKVLIAPEAADRKCP